MLVVLTGASGFVGSYTAAALHRAGHEVRALVRPTSRRDHIEPFVSEWSVGDFADPQSQAAAVAGADAVIHNAADWEAMQRGPIPHFERNVQGSLRLLEAARQAGANQFLFVSSGAVYHDILPDRALDEKHPTTPSSLYGAYKAAVERFLPAYHHTYGMNTSAWRPVGIYGLDPERRRSHWFDIVNDVKNGRAVSTDKGGKVVHVQDVAEALTLAIGDESTAGQIYNLVDGYVYFQAVAEIAKELTGSAAPIEDRKGPGARNSFDTRKAIDFFNRHGNAIALRRGAEGVRAAVTELLQDS